MTQTELDALLARIHQGGESVASRSSTRTDLAEGESRVLPVSPAGGGGDSERSVAPAAFELPQAR